MFIYSELCMSHFWKDRLATSLCGIISLRMTCFLNLVLLATDTQELDPPTFNTTTPAKMTALAVGSFLRYCNNIFNLCLHFIDLGSWGPGPYRDSNLRGYAWMRVGVEGVLFMCPCASYPLCLTCCKIVLRMS